jgi:HNH endonuclease
MIELSKLNEPDVLKEYKEEWRAQYLSYFDHDGDKYIKKSDITIPNSLVRKYNNSKIKAQLLKETNEKCAYCESKMLHITYSDIEHIKPKSLKPELIFEWENLTIACEECNRRHKKDYYDENAELLNPFKEDPGKSIYAFGPLLKHVIGNKKGWRSCNIIGLNREKLIERRIDRIKNVSSMIDQWYQETNEGHKNILYKEILKEMEPDKEYSLVIKYLLISDNIISV